VIFSKDSLPGWLEEAPGQGCQRFFPSCFPLPSEAGYGRDSANRIGYRFWPGRYIFEAKSDIFLDVREILVTF